jgi:hypothetical protein
LHRTYTELRVLCHPFSFIFSLPSEEAQRSGSAAWYSHNRSESAIYVSESDWTCVKKPKGQTSPTLSCQIPTPASATLKSYSRLLLLDKPQFRPRTSARDAKRFSLRDVGDRNTNAHDSGWLIWRIRIRRCGRGTPLIGLRLEGLEFTRPNWTPHITVLSKTVLK